MDPRTCASRRRSAGTAVAALVAIACALVASATLAAAPSIAEAAAAGPSRATALRGRTDAQLARLAAMHESEATRLGEQLLESDARRDVIAADRDVARDLLGSFLAEAYKEGSFDGSLLGEVFAAGSLREAADRLRVAQVVGEHHGNLIRSLEDAEARLDVSRFERAQLIARLGAIQRALVEIRAEQDRRASIRAARDAEARSAAARRARAARRAASAPITAPGALVAAAPFAAIVGAPTAGSIDGYLASKGSPMTGQGAAFMASGQRWRVDPRLLVAIAGAESSFGRITCGPHNAWGWACPNDPTDFATWAAGIDTVTRGLRRYYLDEGRTSVSLIQQKYCPVGAANDPTGLNSHWTTNVTKFLLEQGGNPAMVGPGPGAAAPMVPDFGGLGLRLAAH